MFNLTRNELDTFAKETGFLKNSLEKMFRLLDILSILKTNPVTKNAFVLKGGTALNLFILDIPRISVDIDLNYIQSISRSSMLKDRRTINSEIQKIFHPTYEIRMSKDVHALTQFEFRYATISGSSDMLKLEINYLKRITLLSPQIVRINRFDRNINFLCLDFLELLASKTIALLNRYTPRDLFDVYQMINSPFEIKKELFKMLLFFYGIITETEIFELFKLKFDLIIQADIQNKLYPMLQKRTHLDRYELVANVENFLNPYLSLSDKEAEVLHNLYKTGKIDMDILFPQKEIQEKALNSPSLKWKIINIIKNR
ncbi:MAG: nucleotidyl transferase AbiEii/AbiGii toxin family protein [Candidatus Aminicenantes bacterium]|nr:nucleotidyl transferase AbiEii/AbiGii toxin family protein [Candidatus Aminicenantes bacterium]